MVQAAATEHALGGGYRGVGYAVAARVRRCGCWPPGCSADVLLGPLAALTSPQGLLDRRWTMIGSDVARLGLFVVAPLWIDWMPGTALAWLLVTVFVTGVAERLWTVAREGAAPALLPAQPRATAYAPARTTSTHCAGSICGRRSWRCRSPPPR